MNDLTIDSATVLFMERLVLDCPSAAAGAGGITGGKQQPFPHEACTSHADIPGIVIMPDRYPWPIDSVLIQN
jgi:hypothetical protein